MHLQIDLDRGRNIIWDKTRQKVTERSKLQSGIHYKTIMWDLCTFFQPNEQNEIRLLREINSKITYSRT